MVGLSVCGCSACHWRSLTSHSESEDAVRHVHCSYIRDHICENIPLVEILYKKPEYHGVVRSLRYAVVKLIHDSPIPFPSYAHQDHGVGLTGGHYDLEKLCSVAKLVWGPAELLYYTVAWLL